jgi:hypothetical protein
MKTFSHLSCPAFLAVLLISPLLAQAATPTQLSSRLDKRLTEAATAAEQHQEAPLRDAALLRQANRTISIIEPHWNAQGQVQVYLHFDRDGAPPDAEQLAALGATGIVISQRLGVIQAWVPAAELSAAADLPGVLRVGLPRYALPKRAPAIGPVYATGSVDTQGDSLLHASAFRRATGVTGKGVTVGVISDGDQHIADSQKSGDLPQNIWNDPKDAGGKNNFSIASTGDEGTAMMEIVYDLAPGVDRLGFCGPQTSMDFITCLDDFKTSISPKVIVDDLGFPGGAMFSDDDFMTAIASFAKDNPSIHLVTAAGNDGTGFWQGDWAPMPVSTTVNGIFYTQAQNFDASGSPNPYLHIQGNTGDTLSYVVEWADPWNDGTKKNDPNDYDVVVFDSNTGSGIPVACNQGINIGPTGNGTKCNQHNTSSTTSPGPTPVQGNSWTASQTDYYLEVFYSHGNPSAHIKILVFDNQASQVQLTPSTEGSIYGHAALADSVETTAGAIFSGDLSLQSFSSTGPVEMGTTGQTITHVMKPDFVAPDGVDVTGAGGFQTPFFGTSAAAPHIAGLMALMLSGYPGQSPYNLLKESATPSGVPNGEFGHGLPDLQTLLDEGRFPTPTVTITAPADHASLTVDQRQTFTGTCSTHGAGTANYDWNFGSNSGIADAKAATAHVTFKKTGTYTVTLTCAAQAVSGTASVTVAVTTPSSGGGEFDLLSLLALGLVWLRRRR